MVARRPLKIGLFKLVRCPSYFPNEFFETPICKDSLPNDFIFSLSICVLTEWEVGEPRTLGSEGSTWFLTSAAALSSLHLAHESNRLFLLRLFFPPPGSCGDWIGRHRVWIFLLNILFLWVRCLHETMDFASHQFSSHGNMALQLKKNPIRCHWWPWTHLDPHWFYIVKPSGTNNLHLTPIEMIKITRLLSGIGTAGVKTTVRQIEFGIRFCWRTETSHLRVEAAAPAHRSGLSSAETSHYGSAWDWAAPQRGGV